MSRRKRKGNGWLRAKLALQQVAAERLGAAEVGWTTWIGRGLSRDVFIADIDAGELASRWVALVPRYDAPLEVDERARREAALLPRLVALQPPFRMPAWAAVVTDQVEAGERAIMVRPLVSGYQLGEHNAAQSLQVVAEVAAAVHGLGITAELQQLVPGYSTRREHAQALLSEVEPLMAGEPLAVEALAWAREHLPPATAPSHLLHGDLLAQNIVLSLEDEPPGVIDWECCYRGDPAYDLAIVTRGARKPFKQKGGLQRLLDAYQEAGGVELARTDVQVYELYLKLLWLGETLQGDSPAQAEDYRGQLRGLLGRLG